MFLALAFFSRKYTQNAKKKTYFFFEHKGTRIFETNKSLFYKKHDIHPFLNYPIFFMNEMPVFPYIFPFDHPVYSGERNDLSGSSTRALASAHTNARTPSHERSHPSTRTVMHHATLYNICTRARGAFHMFLWQLFLSLKITYYLCPINQRG